MLRRYRVRLAKRFSNPLIQLLILDWRFSCVLVIVAGMVGFAGSLPLKLWTRTPPGFTPKIKISTLDFLQAHALWRTAQKADERGQAAVAISSWDLALANDPGNEEIAIDYVEGLLRSRELGNGARALQVAGWLRTLHPTPQADQLLIAAADRNQVYDLVLEINRASRASVQAIPEVQLSVLEALFRLGNFPEAKAFVETRIASPVSPVVELYEEALDCILSPGADIGLCQKLEKSLDDEMGDVTAHELYLVVCAEKRNLETFQKTLASLKRITDQSLAFDLKHAQLLLEMGLRREAREVASAFPPPRSAMEAFRLAEGLVEVGEKIEAVDVLRRYCPVYFDSIKHWVLYVQLVLEQGNKDELRLIAAQLNEDQFAVPLVVLSAGISFYLQPTASKLVDLQNALEDLSRAPFQAEVWYFTADALLAAGKPELACDTLLKIESHHLYNSDYYRKIFAAAEASRNADLMRRAAARWYELAPTDMTAMANHAAMLVIFAERPEEAVALTARYAQANPDSVPARINHAAALINAGSLGTADLILKELDEGAIPTRARNQLRFIKLKRALNVRDKQEIVRLAPLIDKSLLYSAQVGWLHGQEI